MMPGLGTLTASAERQICIDRRASLPRPAPTLGALRTAQEPDAVSGGHRDGLVECL